MKKIITMALGLSSVIALAQSYDPEYDGRMGINTRQPKASLDIREQLNGTNPIDNRIQGLSLPNFTTAQRQKLGEGINTDMRVGTLIYNSTEKCIEMYNGYENGVHQWSCLTTSGSGNSGSNSSAGTQGVITGDVVLGGKTHYIASIKDNEYIPFVKPMQLATWEVGETNGNDPMIDIPGIITTQGVEVRIPIATVGNGGTIGAYRQEVTITAEKSKNNQEGILILEWDTQQVTNSDKFITAKLKAKNIDFHIKQLDLTKGLGSDYKGLILANFTYKKDSNNSTMEALTVRAISSIPDKKFGVKTNNKFEHDFIYLPMRGPDGKLWLNNNLGAEYAKIDSQYFSPMRQAGALDTNGSPLPNPTADQIKRDFRAYGYLFEWSRDSDGHEVITWTSETQGTFANPNLQHYDNSSTSDTKGDPCPSGFHTPTETELRNLQTAITGVVTTDSTKIDTNKLWNEAMLKLPAPGFREATMKELTPTRVGRYWSSTLQGHQGWNLYFTKNTSRVTVAEPTYGYPIRCIAD